VSRFAERLLAGPPLVGDGGMGALVSAAVPGLRCPEEANLRAPESIVSVHVAYIRAGAQVIETNTFGANRPKLASLFLEDEFERINSTAVRLAREAREVSGQDVFVAGSIGPLGDVELRGEAQSDLFAEQAGILEGRGVDLFMVETFYDLDELETAVAAVRSVSSLPVVALMTFDQEAQTLAGVTAAEAGRRLRALEVAAIGANHGAGPAAALAALATMDADGTPLAALPNVGLASLSGTRIVYPHASPEYFGEFAAQARELGARRIGGCGGTTPAQVEAIRAAVYEQRRPAGSIFVDERVLAPAPPPVEAETHLAALLAAGEFVISVQLDPPLGGNNAALLEAASALRTSGKAHVVDVNDNPRARASMSGIMAAVAIERATGIETIPHLTPRDSTIVGLESLLLGAHAEGVRNVLCVTGDPPEAGDYPGLAGGVYQVDSVGLVELVVRLNRGEDWHGREIDAPTSFFPGVAVNPSADDLDEELRRFERKVEAGARFAMTQVLFDVGYLDRFLELLGGAWPIPALVGVWPLPSHALAVRIDNEVPGIVVPEPVQERLRAAGAGAGEAGMEIARELIGLSRERAAGVYVVAPFRRPLGVLDLL
jgi:methionine synthase I (cobalamin-dependent)/5,10-methylenetetrahydrofolate reductase